MKISSATAADIPALAALAALTFPLACPPEVSGAESSAFVAAHLSETAFRDYLADPSCRVICAFTADQLVGYALLRFDPPSDPEVAAALERAAAADAVELSKCYVHPDHHGRGAAGSLMAAAIQVAADRDRPLWLGVNDRNLRARAFYAKNGFREVGRRSFTVGSHVFRDFLLARPVAPVRPDAAAGPGFPVVRGAGGK